MKRISFAAALLATVMTGSIFANAQQRKFQEGLSNRGIVLTPLINYIEGDKGQTLTGKFQLTNDFQTAGKVDVYPYTANFITDNSGAPLRDTSERPIDNDFAKWFTLETDKYTLEHKEIKEFNYTIKIPANAAGGTHSAFILFPRTKVDIKPGETPTAEAKDQLALPIFLTITSDIDFKSEIGDMYITDIKNEKKETSFLVQLKPMLL